MSVTLTLTGASGVTAVTPRFDFSAGTVKVEVNDVYVKDLTSGVEDNIALSEGDKLEYIISDYDSVTRIDIYNDRVTGDISGWTFPNNLYSLYVNSTLVYGDISGWALPNSLHYCFINSTNLSGDISGWTLPSSILTFSMAYTPVSGDISSWTLPSGLRDLYGQSSSVSGDISGWTLPSNMMNLLLFSTSVSGDISSWTLPSVLQYLRLESTSVTYASSGGAFEGVTDNLAQVRLDNCLLNRFQVDSVLKDLVTSGVENKELYIGGNNSGPSGSGEGNKSILEGRGWTININSLSSKAVTQGSNF
ncbi:MAG: hypothetical protein ACTSUO_08570 [Candidatus Thorarchaeota archaeon]